VLVRLLLPGVRCLSTSAAIVCDAFGAGLGAGVPADWRANDTPEPWLSIGASVVLSPALVAFVG